MGADGLTAAPQTGVNEIVKVNGVEPVNDPVAGVLEMVQEGRVDTVTPVTRIVADGATSIPLRVHVTVPVVDVTTVIGVGVHTS